MLCKYFYCDIFVFLFDIKRLNILCILEAAQGICAYAWAGCLCSSAWNVTKHRSQSLSPMGINWVSDGSVLISTEYMHCKSVHFLAA